MRKLNIVISGIHYPMSMMLYFIRAFERREDVNLITAGPYTGSWIPWMGGMNLPVKYVYTPTIFLSDSFISKSGTIVPALVEAIIDMDVDLWLQIDAGWHFSKRPKAKIVAHIQTDPHVLKATYELPKSYSDVNFCMQTPYMEQGEYYLPYAYDPTVHYPMPEVDKIYDACMIGLQYETRVNLVKELIRRGRKVYINTGEIFDEYRLKYNQSRTAISWSSLQDLPARVWEAFGMGIPLVTNRVPDLSTFFVENEHYLGFGTLNEAVEKIEWLLDHVPEREDMANTALRKVQNGHTWDHRVTQILETCKLI